MDLNLFTKEHARNNNLINYKPFLYVFAMMRIQQKVYTYLYLSILYTYLDSRKLLILHQPYIALPFP